MVFTEQYFLSFSFSIEPTMSSVRVSELLVLDYYKRCICYHMQSKWTGPFGRDVEKLIMLMSMVTDSF